MTYPQPTLQTGATFSPCGTYRYTLTRLWEPDRGRCTFICFNPSTADAFEDDPTVRRCIGFAQRWGFGSFCMLNLFAFRATDPKEIAGQIDPIGPLNDDVIRQEIRETHKVVLAWGALAAGYAPRVARVVDLAFLCVRRGSVSSLGEPTKDGHPRHPLYLRGDAELRPFFGVRTP